MEEGDPSFWKLLLDRLWPAKFELEGYDGLPLSFEHIVRAARDGRAGKAETEQRVDLCNKQLG